MDDIRSLKPSRFYHHPSTASGIDLMHTYVDHSSRVMFALGHRYSQQVQAPSHEEGIPEVPTIVDVAIRSESNGALYVTQFTLVRPCVRRETSQTSRCSYPMCKPLHPMILKAQVNSRLIKDRKTKPKNGQVVDELLAFTQCLDSIPTFHISVLMVFESNIYKDLVHTDHSFRRLIQWLI
ncbi:hypothetical protein VNO77_23641 [Canavalia gladiata]|uniref:Uncharacterized protein n=1 Tax=Canavalia gladiata TaxID=3824 RepID=A0AAN9L4S8_CANGL